MTASDVVGTPNIEGRAITEYLGVVFATGPTYIAAIQGLVDDANVLGADKVVGLRIDPFSPKRVSAQGTAVRID